MRLLITRHAQTKENESNVIQDENASISGLGHEQISRLIKRLKGEKIDLIISSDFDRCKLTSEKIASIFHIPIEYSSLLREKYDGDWIGKSGKEINWDSLEGAFETRRAPNGESLTEVRDRGLNFLREIMKKYEKTNKTILIVSHGTISRLSVGNLIGLSIRDSIFNIAIDNCSLTEIKVNPIYKKGYLMKFLNESSFLTE